MEPIFKFYLKLAGENTPIQSSIDGIGELYSTVTHSAVSRYKKNQVNLDQQTRKYARWQAEQ